MQPDSFAQVVHHAKLFGVEELALLRPPLCSTLRPVNEIAVAEDGIQELIKAGARRFPADRGRHEVAGEGNIRRICLAGATPADPCPAAGVGAAAAPPRV